MSLETLAQTVVNALFLSSIYILMAAGFALILGIMRILNFAHGVLYMVGAYVCYYWGVVVGLPPWAAILMSTLVVGLFGLFLEKFCFRPFQGDFDRTLMVSLALIIILQTAADVTVGAYVKALPSVLPGILTIAGVNFAADRLVAFSIGIGLLLLLTLLIRRAKVGQQMLAVSQDREAAALQGIDANRVSAFAFALACAFAAVAGALMGSIFTLQVYMGDYMLVKVIAVVILAGIGSIGGVFVSGLIIGSLDATLPILIGGAGGDAVGFALVILVLLIRPKGLFGHEM
jgi:branched-chain amino acid transport system permease protein